MLDRMMECSQEQLSVIAKNGEKHQIQVVHRVLESPRRRRRWESAHCQLLRSIVDADAPAQQAQQVRRMALSMIHRKAPFEYLRDRRVGGAARERFFSVVYGWSDFTTSVLNEHRNYLEACASYYCVDRFCAESSMRALFSYERRYAIYLRAQVRQLDEEHCGVHTQPAAWLGHLRKDLQLQRRKLMGMSPSRADELTLEELRRPTGDTVRLTFLAPA
jgi:hypothetical protein